MKPLLIDCSLTGGRGPAKKARELTRDLDTAEISYLVLTDRGFGRKLTDLGVRVDLTVDVSLNDSPQKILSAFCDMLESVDYGLLLKLGARAAGPAASRRLGKPYVIVDGGLPDRLDDTEDSLYSRAVFAGAEKYLLTIQFAWRFPDRSGLTNIETCCYPISRETWQLLDKLKSRTKLENLTAVRKSVVGDLPTSEDDPLVDLVMTGDYLTPDNRIAYGGWLTARQYDQSVGFVRRLVTDLGEGFEKVYVFMDRELREVVTDLERAYPNVRLSSFRDGWDFETELTVKAAADLTISRATNYQPYIAALGKGGNVTTPVPADGYMDEDTAGEQYAAAGLTRLITHDDENYLAKLRDFLAGTEEHQRIAASLTNNVFLRERNLNRIVLEFCREFCR